MRRRESGKSTFRFTLALVNFESLELVLCVLIALVVVSCIGGYIYVS